jgi:hypothetical protein
MDISMSLFVRQKPSRLCFSDSSFNGIGGWNTWGRVWRMQFPKMSILYANKKVYNLLEFIGMAINILLEVQFEPTTTGTANSHAS